MSGPTGYALTQEIETEIVAAYAAALHVVAAVTSAPGWYLMGSFYLPKTLAACRLDAIAHVSAAGLTGTVRLYDPTAGTDAPVSGSEATITALTGGVRALSGKIALLGDHVYLVQMQVVGAVGVDKFGTLETAGLARV